MYFMKNGLENRAIFDMKRSESENFAYQKFRSMPNLRKISREIFNSSVSEIRSVIATIVCHFYARKFDLFQSKILEKI